MNHFTTAGFAVALDQPFAGAMVPLSCYRKDSRVAALMIEVRRDLYMDAATGARAPRFQAFRLCLRTILETLLRDWERG